MLKLLILLSAVACAMGAAIPEGMLPQLDGRIVGGVATTINEVPWQVSLQRSGYHFCGGSIYSEQIIVTAAHCLQSASTYNLRVRAGSTYRDSGGVLMEVAAIKYHESYSSRRMVNDIAVIRLSNPLTFTSLIKPIDWAKTAPADGAAASVTGWGNTKSSSYALPTELRYVDVKIVSLEKCSSSSYGYGSSVQPSMICAYDVGKDSCQGDSGGPLVSGGVLVGVVSWGYGCAVPGYPGVYADVAALRSWLISAADNV